MNASVQSDGILLNDNLLLNQGIDLLFEEVALVDIINLQLLVIFLKIWDIFDYLFKDIVCRLRCMML